jgi:tetratricopeptide (TPR) repeat protein
VLISRPGVRSATQTYRSVLALLFVLGLFGGGCDRTSSERAVREAEELAAKKRWEEAAEAFSHFPEEVAAWRPFGAWRAASIYRDELNDLARAEDAFSDCAKNWSGTDWGYVCRVELGQLRVLQENHPGAIDAFRGALEIRPRGAYAETCLLESGRAYLALEEPELARFEWDELLKKFPSTPLAATVALERARSFDFEGRHREAVEAYRAVAARYEGHSVVSQARFGEGECLEQLGLLEEALVVFRSLVQGHENPAVVELKIAAVQRRIARRNTTQATIFENSKAQADSNWDRERGIPPSGDRAVGQPMESVD